MYTERLRAGEEDRLRVHCYRALLEQLLVTKQPGLRHTQLKTVARAHQLDFPSYVRQVEGLSISKCHNWYGNKLSHMLDLFYN